MKRFKIFFTFLSLLFIYSLIYSCNTNSCRFCNKKQQGAIFQNIRCKADTSILYNIFVPSETDTVLPLLIFLDPHGNTAFALNKYSQLAEKHKIILAGFDAYYNGLPYNIVSKKFKIWFNEVYTNAPVDTTKIFLSGFSGGARAISLLESETKNVLATALCGAGPANLELWNTGKQPAMFFVGSSDFNYNEVISIFNNKNIRRTKSLCVFKDSHEWPNANLFEDFFILINRLSNKNTNIDENIYISRAQELVKSNRFDLAINNISNAIFAIGAEKPSLNKLRDSLNLSITEEFKSKYNSNLIKEYTLQNRIYNYFQDLDTIKYFALLDSVRLSAKVDSFSLESDVMNRIIGYCGILAYTFTKRAYDLQSNNLYNFLKIYEYTEPANIDMMLFHTAYYAKNKNCILAKKFIDMARANGLQNNDKRLNLFPEFNNCKELK
ncbi:MAG: hypothetical protein GX259_11575 [Bacteroidales bacterium]|nr:hypothetical protein [Bacteroidales bacterium]